MRHHKVLTCLISFIAGLTMASVTIPAEASFLGMLAGKGAEHAYKKHVENGASAADMPAGMPLNGFAGCPQFFPGGKPPQVPGGLPGTLRQLCFDSFAVLHSGQSHTPLFSVERLTAEQLRDAKGEERTNKFFADARLPSAERATLGDYKNNAQDHYDRGHMAPAGDMPNAQAMAQSFSLANMIPQDPTNNRKTWAGIEGATRKYVLRSQGPVFVFTGPVFANKPVHTIGPNAVWVPSHIYKLVYDASTGRAWAHWVENTAEARATRPIEYNELVKRVGIDFLAGIRLAQ